LDDDGRQHSLAAWHGLDLERLEDLMTCTRIALAAFAVLAAMRAGGAADAADIRVLSSGSLKAGLSQLLPAFQKSSGNVATIEYGPAGAIVDRVQKDDAADVVIVSRSQIQKLEGTGKVVQGSLVNIAGIALGVAVRKGAPKPDISNVEAFKRALLSARSIGYRDPATGSTSGIYTANLLERLGIAEDLKAKIDKEEKKQKKEAPKVTGADYLRPGPETPSMTPGMPNLTAPPKALPSGSF